MIGDYKKPRLPEVKSQTMESNQSLACDRHDTLIRKHVKKPGLRGKIDAKCIECLYDPYQPGTWRKQVKDCSCWHCPLYKVRAHPV